MHQASQKRVVPWFICSLICFFLLGALIIFCSFITYASTSGSSLTQQPSSFSSSSLSGSSNEGAFPFIDWSYWQNINPDIVAWIHVPDTSINYAIVQAPSYDPAYYLTHDLYHNWNPYGCPYIDADLEGLSCLHTVVYGHNMGFCSLMFSDFTQFLDKDYAQAHPFLFIQTPVARLTLTVSSCELIQGTTTDNRIAFQNGEELSSWYDLRFAQSDMQLENKSTMTKLFTFVTCSSTFFSNERTLVHAQLSAERIPS